MFGWFLFPFLLILITYIRLLTLYSQNSSYLNLHVCLCKVLIPTILFYLVEISSSVSSYSLKEIRKVLMHVLICCHFFFSLLEFVVVLSLSLVCLFVKHNDFVLLVFAGTFFLFSTYVLKFQEVISLFL